VLGIRFTPLSLPLGRLVQVTPPRLFSFLHHGFRSLSYVFFLSAGQGWPFSGQFVCYDGRSICGSFKLASSLTVPCVVSFFPLTTPPSDVFLSAKGTPNSSVLNTIAIYILATVYSLLVILSLFGYFYSSIISFHH